MKSAAPFFPVFSLLAPRAAAQHAAPDLSTPPAERYEVQRGGIPSLFLSAGGYAASSDLGAGQIEGRVLVSALGIPSIGPLKGVRRRGRHWGEHFRQQ